MIYLQSWWASFGPVVAGLAIGTAAKYGLVLSEGKIVTPRALAADLLLLGILGLVAVGIADIFALTGNLKVMVGALAAVSSDRLVRLLRDRFAEHEGKLVAAIVAALGAAAAGAIGATLASHAPAAPPPAALPVARIEPSKD